MCIHPGREGGERVIHESQWYPQTKKPIVDTHTHTHTHTKESKHNTKYSHQITQGKTAKGKGTKETYKNNPKTMSKMSISTYLAIITWSINGLNTPIKRYRLTKWILKQRPIHMMLTRDTLHI